MTENRREKICKILNYLCLSLVKLENNDVMSSSKKGQKLKLILQDIWQTVNSEQLKHTLLFTTVITHDVIFLL